MKTNTDEVLRQLRGKLERQIPFAVSKALNDTGKQIQQDLAQDLERLLDRPTPFTKRAFGLKRATKTSPRITIFIKDIQAQYLQYAISGGRRDEKVQPVNTRLNKYGNIPGLRGNRKIRALLARPDTFNGRINGTEGIWQRTKSGLKLLMVFDQTPTYQRRFPFRVLTVRSFKRNIYANTRKAVIQAIRTAR